MKGKVTFLFAVILIISGLIGCSSAPATSDSGVPAGKSWSEGKEYLDLAGNSKATIKADVTIEAGTKGVIMEAGAYATGLALYVEGGKLYFQCGPGASYMAAGQSAVSAPVSPGKHVIIVTADAGASKVIMYIDGKMVAQSDTKISGGQLAGQNGGGVGKVYPQADHVTNGPSGVIPSFSGGTINSVTVWPNKIVDVNLI